MKFTKSEQTFLYLLLGGHFLTYFDWFIYFETRWQQPPLCWPYFQDCGIIRDFLKANGLGIFHFYFYFCSLVLIAALFGLSRKVQLSLLFLLSLSKWLIISTDFSFTSNANYLHLFVCLAFIFSGQPLRSSSWVLLLTYWFSAWLKLDSDWMSRAGQFGLPEKWGFLLLGAVVVLELLGPILLLQKKRTLRWLAWLCFMVFHFISILWIQSYLALQMMILLLVFPLIWAHSEIKPPEPKKSILNFLVPGVFLAVHLSIFLAFPDRALNSVGRYLVINFLDARVSCKSLLTIQTENKESTRQLEIPRLPERVVCDTLVHYQSLQHMCRRKTNSETWNFKLLAKRSDQESHTPILDLKNICSTDCSLSWLGKVSCPN